MREAAVLRKDKQGGQRSGKNWFLQMMRDLQATDCTDLSRFFFKLKLKGICIKIDTFFLFCDISFLY